MSVYRTIGPLVSSPEPSGTQGQLIVYPCCSVRPWSVCKPFSKIFYETAWPIKAKFHVEPPWEGETKVCLWHLGHMTKMATTAIYVYGKNPSKISGTSGQFSMNLGM